MKISFAVIMGGLFVALAGPMCWAAGGGEAGHHEVHFGKDIIFQIFNFILLVCLLLYVYRKYSGGGFEKRSRDIQAAMEGAVQAKKDAEGKYLEYQKRIALLDDEIEKILELARLDAEKERLSIVEEARSQSQKIVEQAQHLAKQEVALAKQELRKEAAELAAGMAADSIRRAMKPEDQRNWVQAYIDKIGEVQ